MDKKDNVLISHADELRRYLEMPDWLCYDVFHVANSHGDMAFDTYRIDRISGNVQYYSERGWEMWWMGDITVFPWMKEHIDELYAA